MNSLLDEDDEYERKDRELTLSTGAILAIFLGLVLLCGSFFGFGYKMGSHKVAPIVTAEPGEPAVPTGATASAGSTDFSSFKPAAGSPAGSSAAGSAPAPRPSVAVAPADARPAATPGPLAAPPASAHVTPPTPVHPPAPIAVESAAVPAGSFVVQIAAISVTHQEDADLLVSALKSKGYAVAAHAEPDHFIHVQVGPYANRKDAEAMRTRLSADGYQPFIK